MNRNWRVQVWDEGEEHPRHIGCVSLQDAHDVMDTMVNAIPAPFDVRIQKANWETEVYYGWVITDANGNLVEGAYPNEDRAKARLRQLKEFVVKHNPPKDPSGWKAEQRKVTTEKVMYAGRVEDVKVMLV